MILKASCADREFPIAPFKGLAQLSRPDFGPRIIDGRPDRARDAPAAQRHGDEDLDGFARHQRGAAKAS